MVGMIIRLIQDLVKRRRKLKYDNRLMLRKFYYQCKILDIFNLFDFFFGSVKFSDFEFLKVIGKGSFGRVLFVRNKNEGNIYVIKVL